GLPKEFELSRLDISGKPTGKIALSIDGNRTEVTLDGKVVTDEALAAKIKSEGMERIKSVMLRNGLPAAAIPDKSQIAKADGMLTVPPLAIVGDGMLPVPPLKTPGTDGFAAGPAIPGLKLIAELPESLQQAAHGAVWKLRDNASLSPDILSGFEGAHRLHDLPAYLRAINTRLTEDNTGLSIVDTTPPGSPPGMVVLELRSAGQRMDEARFIRPLATIADLPPGLSDSLQQATEELTQGNTETGLQSLKNGLNAAAFQNKVDDFIDAFNTEMQRSGQPFQISDITPPNSGIQKKFGLEKDGTVIGVADVVIPRGPVAAQPPSNRDVLAGDDPLPTEATMFSKRASTAQERFNNRQEAIAKVESSSSDRQLVDGLKAIHMVATVQDGKTPSEAADLLEKLLRLDEDGNKEAERQITALTEKLGGKKRVEALIGKLKAGDSAALAELQQGLPSSSERLDQLRTRFIVESLDPTSSHQKLKEARFDLNDEKMRGNISAKEALNNVETEIALIELNNPETSDAAIDKIIELAKTSTSAKDLLTAIVASKDATGSWKQIPILKEGNAFASGDRLDMSPLSPQARDAIILKAATGLTSLSKDGGTMRAPDAAALAIALRASIDQGDGDGELVKTIREGFEELERRIDFKKDWPLLRKYSANTEAAMKGIFASFPEAQGSDSKGSFELARIYTRLAGSENNFFSYEKVNRSGDRVGIIGEGFKQQVESFKKSALNGNPIAIYVLAAISGGVGSNNEHANPKETNHKGEWIPGTSLANEASEALIAAAEANPSVRTTALAILTSDGIKGEVDSAHRLHTLGTIAALNPSDVPPSVRSVLRDGLSKPETHVAAVRGMLALGAALDSEDIRRLALSVNADTVPLLKNGAHRITPEQGSRLCDELAKRAIDPVGTFEHRLQVVKALSALGAYHVTPSSLETLSRFSGPEGAKLITSLEGFPGGMEKQDADGFTPVERMQKEAALALLDIAERNTNPVVKNSAFEVLATGGWGRGFDETMRLSNNDIWTRLHKLMIVNPESVTIQRYAPKLLHMRYADGTAPRFPIPKECEAGRLAAALIDRGASAPDAVLLRFSQMAIQRLGSEKVNDVLDRMSLFNALPPDMQKELTSFTGTLPDGVTLPLNGRDVEAAVFNSLPEAERIKLFGSAAKIPETGTVKLNDSFTVYADTFNSLPPEVQRALLGDGEITPKQVSERARPETLPLTPSVTSHGIRPMLAGESLSLEGKTLDAALFNQLTDEQRRRLTGSPDKAPEKSYVPDLSRVILTSDHILKLTESQRVALGLPKEPLPPGCAVRLRGITIDANTFNDLPEQVKIAI
ncbi:MAG: hypothetical protein K2Z81_18905, partial [Cyanobacteria bacterium]|nr:hypothetical protein [Cyanobacteriota bacterium]